MFQKPKTIQDIRNEFKDKTGKIAVSHKGKCTFEYFKYLEEMVLELSNKEINECYNEFGEDL